MRPPVPAGGRRPVFLPTLSGRAYGCSARDQYLQMIWESKPINTHSTAAVLFLDVLDHLAQVLDFWMSPPAPARGLAHTLLRNWMLFCALYGPPLVGHVVVSRKLPYSCLNSVPHKLRKKNQLGRRRKPTGVRVALGAFCLATPYPPTRSGPDVPVVLCY